MPVQDGVGLHLAGEQGLNLRGSFPDLALQSRGLHSKSDEGVAVNNIAQIHLLAQRFRQHERVECQKELLMPMEFVGEDESNRNELRRFAWRVPWRPLHSVNC
jgi:hypothetical protein